MPDRQHVIDSLVCVARPIMAQQGWNRDSCIAGTRIGLEALMRYGIAAEPLSVGLVAMNPAAVALMRKQPIPENSKEPKIVYAHHRGPTQPWEGHVVITSGHDLIDLTLDQFSREDADLILQPMAIQLEGAFLDREEHWVDIANGCVVRYIAFPADSEYQTGPSWTATNLQAPVLEAVLQRLQDEVGPPDPPAESEAPSAHPS